MKPLDGETIGAVSTEAGLYLLFDRDRGNIVSIGQSWNKPSIPEISLPEF